RWGPPPPGPPPLPPHWEPMEIARFLGVNTRSVIVQHLSFVLGALTSRQVQAIGAAAVLIGLVFAAEGLLLAMRGVRAGVRCRGAPSLTIVLTALGIPPEVIEIARRPGSARRYGLLAVNVAILIYIWKRRNEFRIGPRAD